jgi:integration host factor subunit alpha
MRINLTKKDITNAIYMQIGFSKKISENLFDDIFDCILENLIKFNKIKISNFGTFIIKRKKSRPGINFKTKEKKIISERNVLLFKPSKEFKELINSKNE